MTPTAFLGVSAVLVILQVIGFAFISAVSGRVEELHEEVFYMRDKVQR